MTFEGFQDTLVADWAEGSSIPMGADGVITYSIDSSLSQYAGFINDTFAQLEASLDIDFVEVEPDRIETTQVRRGRGKKFSEVQTFVESEAELEFVGQDLILGDRNIAGLADYQGDGSWDLIVKTDNSYTDEFNKYIILHELGHGLGLEHPFSYTDGDGVDGITGEQSVMSYDWTSADFFREADVSTLEGMWNDGNFSEAEVASSTESFFEGEFTISKRQIGQMHQSVV